MKYRIILRSSAAELQVGPESGTQVSQQKNKGAGLRVGPESGTPNFQQLHVEFRDTLIKNKKNNKI